MAESKQTVWQDFTVRIDEPTHTKLRFMAFDQHRPMADIVREAIRNHIDLHARASAGAKR